MANVGTLAVKLSANAADLHGGVDGALRKLQSFASQAGKLAAAPIGSLSNALNAPGQALGNVLGPLKGVLSNLPGIGGAFAALPASAEQFVQFLGKGQEIILDELRTAEKLGITMKEAAGLRVLGGSRAEDLEHAVNKMEVFVGKARSGDASSRSTLSRLGLNVQDLGSVQDAYTKITGGINKMTNASDKAMVSQEVFSKAGANLGDILAKSWEKASDKAEQYGLVVSRAEAQQLKELQRLQKDMALRGQGLQVQAARAALPLQAGAQSFLAEHASSLFSGDFSPLALHKAAQKAFDAARALGTEKAEPEGEADPEQQARERAFTATVNALKVQNVAMSGGAQAAALYKLELDGLTDAHLKLTPAQQKQVEGLLETQRALERINKMPAVHGDFLDEYKAKIEALQGVPGLRNDKGGLTQQFFGAQKRLSEEFFDKVQEKAFALAQSVRTPFEIIKDELKQINDLAGLATNQKPGVENKAIAKALGGTIADPLKDFQDLTGLIKQNSGGKNGLTPEQTNQALATAVDKLSSAVGGGSQVSPAATVSASTGAALSAIQSASVGAQTVQERLLWAIEEGNLQRAANLEYAKRAAEAAENVRVASLP